MRCLLILTSAFDIVARVGWWPRRNATGTPHLERIPHLPPGSTPQVFYRGCYSNRSGSTRIDIRLPRRRGPRATVPSHKGLEAVWNGDAWRRLADELLGSGRSCGGGAVSRPEAGDRRRTRRHGVASPAPARR